MKKLLLLLILLGFFFIGNTQVLAPKGIKIGKVKTGTGVITVDSITQRGTGEIIFWKGAQQLNPNLIQGFKIGTTAVTVTAAEINNLVNSNVNIQAKFDTIQIVLDGIPDVDNTITLDELLHFDLSNDSVLTKRQDRINRSNLTIPISTVATYTGTGNILLDTTTGKLWIKSNLYWVSGNDSVSILPLGGLMTYFKMDETTGDAIDEVSALALDGNIITWAQTGQVGTAPYFNGTSSYLRASANALEYTGSLSISAWVYTSRFGVTQYIAGNSINNTEGQGYHLYLNADNKLVFELSTGVLASTTFVTGNTSIGSNTWTHVCATWDGTHIDLYVSGQADAEPVFRSQAISFLSANRFIIGEKANYTAPFQGRIDEVKVWNIGLTGSNALLDYQNGLNGNPLE